MPRELDKVSAAVERYRELVAAGQPHWPAVERAAAEHGVPADVLAQNVQLAEGRIAGPGA